MTLSKHALLALLAMLTVSACGDKMTSTSLLAPTHPYQLTSAQWDEAIAAQTYARTSNAGLIAMR